MQLAGQPTPASVFSNEPQEPDQIQRLRFLLSAGVFWCVCLRERESEREREREREREGGVILHQREIHNEVVLYIQIHTFTWKIYPRSNPSNSSD